jgi:tRNA threonylcarbamoyl adenosine modification protein YeaZ
MIVLGLDTTAKACACALVDEGRVIASISEDIGRGHAERLAPMTGELFAKAGLTPAEIDRIAVCTGPGSFTGLRVALAFAKGLSLPRGVPVLGLSALHVHAARHDPEGRKRLLCFTDVRRGELCLQMFEGRAPLTPALTFAAQDAKDFMAAQDAEIIELTKSISVPLLAWLSMDIAPEDAPATALYARPPDAKLPGGITP